MLKNYVPSKWCKITEYQLVFDDRRHNGFGFPDEFIECEFLDIDYIKNILTKHEYDVYLVYINENYTF